MKMTNSVTATATLSLLLAYLYLNQISAININMHSNEGELIFASVIFRHGDRNIDSVYPKDPYKDEIHWPEGFGQLTNRGKMRQYNLGQYLRRRYDKLLGETYSPKKIYVQSSDLDRTLMSAQICLAGIFPPTSDEIWNSNIFPVHTMPRKSDYLIAIETDCPKYTHLREKYMAQSKEYQRIFTEYGDRIKYWSEMSGLKIKTTYDVYKLYNILTIEKEQNKRIPEWAEKEIKPGSIMEYISAFHFVLYADTPDMARFASGFLIKEIVDHFTQKASATLSPDRALWLYSGHDYSITNALNSFGLFKDIHLPEYSSSLHFELYKTGSGDHYVQMFYRKSAEEHPVPLTIPGCKEKCQLDTFIKVCQKFMPKGDIKTECHL